jgi:BirA family biotin operon repressor/biotin-[acetyl-CoA-carboxylase] ligase
MSNPQSEIQNPQSEMDTFHLGRLKQRLEPLTLGHPLYYFKATDSTNSFLCALPPEQVHHGALALADHQTAGRGRFGRQWSDAPGRSLLFSLVLDATRDNVEASAAHWPLLTLGAAVCVCRTLEEHGITQPRIRWPNDVLIGDRKVCGILTEHAKLNTQHSTLNAHDKGRQVLVLGMGLNVHQTIGDFPPPLRDTAGSLRIAADRPWKRENLLVSFLAHFEKVYDQWRRGHGDRILADCRRHMSTLGRPVCLHSHGRQIEGVVMDLERDGSLVLREPTGIVSRWHSGDVEETRWES